MFDTWIFFFLSPCVNQCREICKMLSTSRAARCGFGDSVTCCSQAGKEELYITNSSLAASALVKYWLRMNSKGTQRMALKSVQCHLSRLLATPGMWTWRQGRLGRETLRDWLTCYFPQEIPVIYLESFKVKISLCNIWAIFCRRKHAA